MRELICIICGKKFQTNSWNASLCSKECRRQRQIEKSAEARERERQAMKEGAQIYDARKKPPKFKSTMKRLTADAVAAKKAGKSYGQYIAQKDKGRY